AGGGEGGAGGGEGGAGGGEGGAGGGEGGAGGAGGGAGGGEGGAGGGEECRDVPTVNPRNPMYDRFEGIGFDNACASDDDCFRGGCSSEVCSATADVASTCEGIVLPDGGCGCVAGECVWHTEECGPCADADDDGTCDADDSDCNADGSLLACRRPAPACDPGTVPEIRDGCYTDVCVTWAQCGVAPCADSDADGICDAEDPACNPDGFVECDAIPPRCEAGLVPVAQGGCWTGECTTWAGCAAIEPICREDADNDGICNADDSNCNADGTLLMCRRVAPNCPAGTVPEVREGCYTDVCVTWAQCGGCADADNDGTCDVDDFDCNADGTPLICRQAPPVCPERGTYPEIIEGCYSGRCVSWADCGDAPVVEACAPIEAGEFGLCRAIIGWGIGAETGICEMIGGCGCDARCEGRVFENEAACQRACPAGEPEPQFCGGIAGIECMRGSACYDDPRDNCAPPRGADCGGVCVDQNRACTPVLAGEFGDCDAIIGVAINARGACVAVSGCGCDIDCAGRVFPDMAQCQAACVAGE
ncbi:MAG: hypothetical protein ACI9U2_004449, partial [Bradymonadia bacterium]